MRKLTIVVAMLAMMLAMAGPASATTVVGGDFDLLFLSAPQFQGADAFQVGAGDTVAVSRGLGSAAGASIDQGLDVGQVQVSGGF